MTASNQDRRLIGRRTATMAIAASVASGLGLTAAPAAAQAPFPSRPIRIVSPFSPGSGVDGIARLYAQRLSEQMGVPVVVETKEGAGGMIGAAYAGKQPADGYTLLVATTPFVAGPITQGQPLYNPVKDFAAVSRIAINPSSFVVGPTVAAKNMEELVAFAKANPGMLTYASSGPGTPSQLDMESLKAAVGGIDIREIPYRSNAQALADLLAGTVSIYYTVQSTALANVRAGKLRSLAVGSQRRTQALPNVPTVAEALNLPNYESLVWYGFVVPAGTPANVVARLHTEITRTSQNPEVVQTMAGNGFEMTPSTSAEFAAQMQREADRWTTLVKSGKVGASK